MNNTKEFLEHFDADFYTGKERVSQNELDKYLRMMNSLYYQLVRVVKEEGFDLDFDYLSNKDLRGLNFGHQKIPNINIRNSVLIGVDVSKCFFRGTDFTGSDLTGARFYGANLSMAKLDMVKGLPTMACPEEGGFAGWKRAKANNGLISDRDVLIHLYIPSCAKRSSATTNKCRASQAFVIDIVDMLTGEKLDRAVSLFDSGFEYRRRKMVHPTEFLFDENRWDECAPGIHFFMDKQSAIEY